jgi:hypothetical protein
MPSKLALLGFVATMVATSIFAPPASGHLVELLGDWRNVDSNTRGLVRIVIAEAADAIEVHAWGACHPSLCDWGTVKALPYAPNVDTRLPAGAQYLLATFTTSFSETLLIIGPSTSSETLSVLEMGRFTRGNGRSNHAHAELFTK